MRWLASIPLLLLSGCGGGVASSSAWLVVPETFTFEDAVFRRLNNAFLPIENTGTAAATMRATVTSGPFLVTGDGQLLRPGEQTRVAIQWTPQTYNGATGTLALRSNDGDWEVDIVGLVTKDADEDGVEAKTAGGDDCDDHDRKVNPDAKEICDDIDNDCDGRVDNPDNPPVWYADTDGDGYGDARRTSKSCNRPTGFVADDTDCDDADSTVNPGVSETWYDGVDQNCDNASDYDADGDGYENLGTGGTDCVDSNPGIHPGAPESEDGTDQDCDGVIDEGFTPRGALVVTELLIEPTQTPNADGQFIEIANTSNLDVTLEGIVIQTQTRTASLPAVVVPRGGIALLCGSVDPLDNGDIDCDGKLPVLLDASDSFALTLDATQLEEVDWRDWTVPAGASLELAGALVDPTLNNDEGNWCTATVDLGNGDFGTPGVATTGC